MPETLRNEKRSLLMARVRRTGTEPELVLRKALWERGLRYRLKFKTKLPGSPDIIFPKQKIAIFVDGCFWHGCPIHGTSPKTNAEFWIAKIQRNKERDNNVDMQLLALGWSPLRFWEHEIKKDIQVVIKQIEKLFREKNLK